MSEVAQHGSVIVGAAVIILALAWFVIKAVVAHFAATWAGKKLATWWKRRRRPPE